MKQKASERFCLSHLDILLGCASFATKNPNGNTFGHTTFTVIKYGNVYSQKSCHPAVHSVKDVNVVMASIFLFKFVK